MVGPLGDNHPMKVSMDEETKLALFEQTIVPHLNEAYNLAAGLTRSKHDAEDVVQEA
jgi:DNA-directed RNA polymerase specialized sigma24 family protein